MIVLVPIDEHGDDGAPIQFNQPYVQVGHGAHNNLILDDEAHATSYEHALIAIIQGRAVVSCDPSAKPTYIDGVDISSAPEEERQLKPGDILSFGKGGAIFRVEKIGEVCGPGEGAPRQVRVPAHATKASPGAKQRPPVPATLPDQSRSARPISFQVFAGAQLVREETLHQPIIRIGRMKSSHLLLIDKSVSRTHAVVELTGENEVLLIDLDSSSGTAVNGTKIKKALLKSGDELSFGEVRVVVRFGQAASSPAASPAGPSPADVEDNKDDIEDDIKIDVEFGANSTHVLSEGEWEAFDGPRLIVRRDGGAQDEVVLAKSQTTIGRLATNDIQLDDGAVSGTHALLVAEAGVFKIVDQKSTNGTYLNGERCTRGILHDGDVIQIGRYGLVFVAPRAGTGPRPGTEILSPEAARALFAKVGGGPRGNR
jgi:pSer/pThr/pTyr-binding forkhead associated (FHA) protein